MASGEGTQSAAVGSDDSPGAGREDDVAGHDAVPHPPRPVRLVARLGLVARGVFYLVLAALTFNLLVRPDPSSRQANANGALRQVAEAPVGFGLLVGAAVGFAVYALVRLAGVARDHRHGIWRRLSTTGQALMYVAMAAVTISFLRGSRATGSEQQQRSTAARLLAVPFGRPLLAVLGLAVLAACTWQVVVAVRGHFADTLRDDAMSPVVRRLTMVAARVGIPARALAIAPVGVFLLVAAFRADPDQAKGLDALLLEWSRSAAVRVLVVLIGVGFAMFAVYSLSEARYRQVASGA